MARGGVWTATVCYNVFMDEGDKKIAKRIDRLIMGIILGGAIGSVLGLTLAPRKGEETRKILKEKGQELFEKGKEVSEGFIRDHREKIEGAKYQIKKGRGFLKWLFGRKKTEGKMPKATMGIEDEAE